MYKKVVHTAKKKTKKHVTIIEEPKQIKKPKSFEWIGLVPIFFIVAFVPLIVYAKIIELSPLEELNWTGGGTLQLEFFSYYKALFFVIATLVALVTLIILHFFKVNRIVKSKYYIPLLIYTVFVILSYLFATDKTIATRGFIEMHEGIFVLLSFVLIIFVIINLVKKEKHILAFVCSFIFIGVIVSFIGIGQYFGYDIFTTDWGILLTLPKVLEPIKDEIEIRFGLFGIYATMGNSNFVGSFAALMIPLGFSLYFYAKKYYLKLLAFIFMGLMIFVSYGANSRAGLIGVIVSILISVILYRKQFIKRPITAFMPFVVILILGFILNNVTEGKIINEIKSMDLIAELKALKEINEDRLRFENIEISEMMLTIETNDESVIIEKKYPTMYAYTIDGAPLELIENNGIYTFSDVLYKNYRITLDASNIYFVLSAYGRNLTVFHTIDGLKIIGQGGERVTPEEVDRLKFLDGYESLFSSRVYIWSRSVPLLKDYILLGAGPDMYPIAFPQNDFVGRFNSMSMNFIVDKPHNMFLQIGINTGLISLIAMITLWGIYTIDSLKLYFNRNLKSFADFMGVGFFLGVIAYLSAGFFNDQILSVAPLFYIMLGVGIAVNKINKHQIQDLKNENLIA